MLANQRSVLIPSLGTFGARSALENRSRFGRMWPVSCLLAPNSPIQHGQRVYLSGAREHDNETARQAQKMAWLAGPQDNLDNDTAASLCRLLLARRGDPQSTCLIGSNGFVTQSFSRSDTLGLKRYFELSGISRPQLYRRQIWRRLAHTKWRTERPLSH